MAGGTLDIETIVAPPGTAHTEPADSLIATLFGGGEQSLSLVDSTGSAMWVANSLAPGLEELTLATPHAPGDPMRGTIGRGGAAVMKGTLKTSTTPSPLGVPNPLQPAIDLATQIEQLEPHLAPGAPRERAADSSMRLYVDNGVGKGGPGIRYGYPGAPGFLHEVMEGTQAFKPGIPNRRLVEDGLLSSAITFCVEDGTPMTFLGPHQLPDHLGLQVGDMADVYLYSNLRDDDSDEDSEEQFTEDDSDSAEDSSDDEEHALRQALLPTRLAVAIDAVHCAIWYAQTTKAMQTCPAVNVNKYTTRLSSSVSTQSSLLVRLHTHELVMLWLNCRALYVAPDCSPPNFSKVVLGVNIHMHTMATKRVHKWLDYITNERPSHRTSVLVSLVQNIAQRLQLADEQDRIHAHPVHPLCLGPPFILRRTGPSASDRSTRSGRLHFYRIRSGDHTCSQRSLHLRRRPIGSRHAPSMGHASSGRPSCLGRRNQLIPPRRSYQSPSRQLTASPPSRACHRRSTPWNQWTRNTHLANVQLPRYPDRMPYESHTAATSPPFHHRSDTAALSLLPLVPTRTSHTRLCTNAHLANIGSPARTSLQPAGRQTSRNGQAHTIPSTYIVLGGPTLLRIATCHS